MWDEEKILKETGGEIDASDFASRYRRLLCAYLSGGGEVPLLEVYELGRTALGSGLGILDVTGAHHQALMGAFEEELARREPSGQVLKDASRFLDEALSPFELARLTSRDANAALRRLYEILEEEAKRIAHILHDESAQLLAVVYLELGEIVRQFPGSIETRINLVIKHLDEVVKQLRELSHELRPLILDKLGLMPALNSLANGMTKRSGLEVVVDGSTGGRLDQMIETVLYRAAQEALANVIRHADASRAKIRVWIEDDQVYCAISDDGAGFEVPEEPGKDFQGLGLIGIRERVNSLNGNCRLTSAPGRGTELRVSIPVARPLFTGVDEGRK